MCSLTWIKGCLVSLGCGSGQEMWLHSGNPFVLQILPPPSFVRIMHVCLQNVKDANLDMGTMAHTVEDHGCVMELPHKARVSDKCEFCSPGGIWWSLTCGNLKFVVTVVQSLNRLWLYDPLNSSTPGFLVLRYLLEFAQIHVHWVSDAIQPPHPPSSASSALSLSQHQSLFQWLSSSHNVARLLELHL